jgi:hypothetical protein
MFWVFHITIVIKFSCREKLVRLEHENRMLRLNQRGPDDEKLSVVQSLLDESTQRANQFCMENRWGILTVFFSDVLNVRSFFCT